LVKLRFREMFRFGMNPKAASTHRSTSCCGCCVCCCQVCSSSCSLICHQRAMFWRRWNRLFWRRCRGLSLNCVNCFCWPWGTPFGVFCNCSKLLLEGSDSVFLSFSFLRNCRWIHSSTMWLLAVVALSTSI
jgi:hypothetical protein